MGVACMALVGPLVVRMAGYQIMVVTSGSMEPMFGAGDAVILRPLDQSQIRVGDVLTYRPLAQADRLTTHRVVSRVAVRGEPHFQTKGDANRSPDANLVPAGHVIGKVSTSLPWIGRVLLFAGSPVGRLVLVGGPALALMLQQLMLAFRRDARGLLGVRTT